MGKEKEFITEITMRSCLLEHINSVFKKKKALCMNLTQLLKLCLDRDMKTMMGFYTIPLSNLHMVKVWCSGATGLQCFITFKEDVLLHLKKQLVEISLLPEVCVYGDCN